MNAVIVFANGFDECEGLLFVDIFRRAGISITTVSITDDLKVHSLHDVDIMADALLKDVRPDDYDVCIVPGGFIGMDNLKESEETRNFVKSFENQHKEICAVCSGPAVLKAYGVGEGHKVTSHFSVRDEIDKADFVDESIVEDEKLITGNGMCASIPAALALVEHMEGKEARDKVARSIAYVEPNGPAVSLIERLHGNDYDEVIQNGGMPCLVTFTRKGCGICVTLRKTLEELIRTGKYDGKFRFYDVDIKEDRPIYKRYDMRGVPQTLLFNKHGERVGRITGAKDIKVIAEKIEKAMED